LPDISIIIVNWNSKDYLRACLQSLARHPPAGLTYEVIVVDGGSFDGCAEMLAREFPPVIFVQSPDNVGFARANNLGAKSATGTVLWLLNPDTEIRGDAAAFLFHALQNNHKVGLVGARLLNTDRTLQTTCVQSLPTPLNQALGSEFLRRLFPKSGLWGISALESHREPVEVEAVPGACVMLRRQDFLRIGGLNPGYFMYAEDMDLCFKIRKAGFSISYVPTAEVVHHGGGSSSRQFSKFSTVLMREAVTYYFRSNYGSLHAHFYRLLMMISAVCRIALLLPSQLISGKDTRLKNSKSLQKWIAILKWCLGGERWAHKYSATK